MKTQNTKLKNFFKGMLFGTLVVALMAATVGCDKKKSKNNNNNNYGYNPYNPGYPGYPGNPGYPGQPGYGGPMLAGIGVGDMFTVYISPTSGTGILNVRIGMGCTPTSGLYPNQSYQIVPGQQQGIYNIIAQGQYVVGQMHFIEAIALPTSSVCGQQGMIGRLRLSAVQNMGCMQEAVFNFSDNMGTGC